MGGTNKQYNLPKFIYTDEQIMHEWWEPGAWVDKQLLQREMVESIQYHGYIQIIVPYDTLEPLQMKLTKWKEDVPEWKRMSWEDYMLSFQFVDPEDTIGNRVFDWIVRVLDKVI